MPHTNQTVSQSQEIVENNDASELFSRFGAFNNTSGYQELLREEAALSASLRWPLLAELLVPDQVESGSI